MQQVSALLAHANRAWLVAQDPGVMPPARRRGPV